MHVIGVVAIVVADFELAVDGMNGFPNVSVFLSLETQLLVLGIRSVLYPDSSFPSFGLEYFSDVWMLLKLVSEMVESLYVCMLQMLVLLLLLGPLSPCVVAGFSSFVESSCSLGYRSDNLHKKH